MWENDEITSMLEDPCKTNRRRPLKRRRQSLFLRKLAIAQMSTHSGVRAPFRKVSGKVLAKAWFSQRVLIHLFQSSASATILTTIRSLPTKFEWLQTYRWMPTTRSLARCTLAPSCSIRVFRMENILGLAHDPKRTLTTPSSLRLLLGCTWVCASKLKAPTSRVHSYRCLHVRWCMCVRRHKYT